MKPQFLLVIPTHNAGRFTKICIDHILAQTYQNFKVILIDDDSIDGTYQNALDAAGNDPRFVIRKNSSNVGALLNIYNGVTDPGHALDDECVVCMLDGDDYLNFDDALEHIAETYERDDCLVTYGNLIGGFDEIFHSNRITDEMIRDNSYRKFGWGYNQLRTFKRKLFSRIDANYYFKWANGEWYRDTYDQAIMFCMFELSGGRISFVERPLYKIGIGYRSDGHAQMAVQNEVQAKTPCTGIKMPRQSVARPEQPKPPHNIRVSIRPPRRT